MRLVGFKSFADRTRLEFEPGVSVVVGPNGTGKSNIVDAVSWVMGTQSTRSLRTEKMEDVIFAGTAERPALGRAEVTLVFDNAERILPLDLDEVAISRRLFRDGTSEYEINGVECRLLDVQELLSDSGVGRHQHVIVGQGQIDTILNAKSDEHRQVIEEAAGILKHRLRKDRAIRRLERTDADVLRLHDITRELKRQMRPLKRQADAAGRYDSVRDELRALRLWLGGDELRTIRSRAKQAEAEQLSFDQTLTADQAELDSLQDRLTALADEAGQTGRDLDRDTAAAARLETTAERLRRLAQVAHERGRAIASRLEGADERRRDLTEESSRLASELVAAQGQEDQARHDAEVRESALQALEDEARSVAEQEAMPAEGALAMARGDLRSLEGAALRDAREIDDVVARLEALDRGRTEAENEAERLRQEIRSTDELIAVAQQVYENRQAGRAEIQRVWERSEALVRSAEVARAAAAARVEALEAAAEGLSNPQARAKAAASPALRGEVSQVFDVPEDVAAAVDAAIAGWTDAMVLERLSDLTALAAALKSDDLGGLPLIAGRSEDAEVPARSLAETWGVEALIDRLGPSADAGLAAQLMGDVVLVEGWSSGWDIVQKEPSIRAVTPEGDLVTPFGLRLADPAGATPAVIAAGRHSLDAAQVDEARALKVEASNRQDFEGARSEERAALEDLEQLEAKLAGTAEALDRLQRGEQAFVEERKRLEHRRLVLDEATGQRDTQLDELRVRLAALEGEEAERHALWEELGRRREELALRREEARRARESAAGDLGAAEERRRMLETRQSTVSRELEELQARPDDPTQLEELRFVEEFSNRTLEAVRAHIGVLRARQAQLRAASGEAGRRLSEARTRESDLRSSVDHAKDRLSGLAVETTELRMREEAVAESLRRDADATEAEAMAADRPDLPEDDDPVARADSLAAELARMGPINPLAADEYRELETRYTHINDQLEDLETSRDDLRKVIRALDEEIEQLFMAAFEETAAHYAHYFGVLFPGGTGKLTLSDPSKPLETGLEIGAQPMGKKVSKLSLLSGGERSLAALAFMFAVFRARPSPFYIMDEVEAALDDSNLRRFLRLVAEFRGSAQLMIITHQQQTMEAADVLYGVTMEPGGSSKALAKRMDHLASFDRSGAPLTAS